MPRNNLGPCTVVSVDPGTTSGVLVLSIKPAWLKGTGPASWEGLGQAVVFKAAYQVGRYPRRFNVDSGRATKIDTTALDEELLPVLAQHQPLLGDEFDGRGRKTQAFYDILSGEESPLIGRGDLSVVDAGEVLQVRQIAGLLDNFAAASLVIENFVPRATVSTDREVNSPDRLRLAIETEEMMHGVGRVPFLQMPSDAMNVATDERLKRANLYFAGMPHATDAARHAATFFRRLRVDGELRSQAFPRHFKGWTDDNA
jgi:hypothetical protein